MKNISLFQLQYCSRKLVDDFMIENNYKILNVDFLENVKHTRVTYKLQSCIINTIMCFFDGDKLVKITFPDNL